MLSLLSLFCLRDVIITVCAYVVLTGCVFMCVCVYACGQNFAFTCSFALTLSSWFPPPLQPLIPGPQPPPSSTHPRPLPPHPIYLPPPVPRLPSSPLAIDWHKALVSPRAVSLAQRKKHLPWRCLHSARMCLLTAVREESEASRSSNTGEEWGKRGMGLSEGYEMGDIEISM